MPDLPTRIAEDRYRAEIAAAWRDEWIAIGIALLALVVGTGVLR